MLLFLAHCFQLFYPTNLAGKPFNGRHAEVRHKRNERASELFLRRSAKSSAAMSFGWTLDLRCINLG